MDQYKSLPSELHVVLANIRLASRYHDFTIVLQRAVSCYGKLSQCGLVWRRIIHLSCSVEVLALDITESISKYAGFFLGWGGRKGPHSKMDWMKKKSLFPPVQYKNLPSELHVDLGNIRLTSNSSAKSRVLLRKYFTMWSCLTKNHSLVLLHGSVSTWYHRVNFQVCWFLLRVGRSKGTPF